MIVMPIMTCPLLMTLTNGAPSEDDKMCLKITKERQPFERLELLHDGPPCYNRPTCNSQPPALTAAVARRNALSWQLGFRLRQPDANLDKGRALLPCARRLSSRCGGRGLISGIGLARDERSKFRNRNMYAYNDNIVDICRSTDNMSVLYELDPKNIWLHFNQNQRMPRALLVVGVVVDWPANNWQVPPRVLCSCGLQADTLTLQAQRAIISLVEKNSRLTASEPAANPSSSSNRNKSRNKSKCAICCDDYSLPVELSCGHIFCFLCIKGAADCASPYIAGMLAQQAGSAQANEMFFHQLSAQKLPHGKAVLPSDSGAHLSVTPAPSTGMTASNSSNFLTTGLQNGNGASLASCIFDSATLQQAPHGAAQHSTEAAQHMLLAASQFAGQPPPPTAPQLLDSHQSHHLPSRAASTALPNLGAWTTTSAQSEGPDHERPGAPGPKLAYVRLPQGNTVFVPICSKVADLMSAVSAKTAIKTNDMLLTFAGKTLPAESSLSSHGILQNSTINLTMRLRGGMPNAGKATVKLPPYWSQDPTLWFAQAEAQFGIAGVTTEETKFYHVISALPPDSALEVRDLILTPPTTDPYTTLKDTLIRRTMESAARRVEKALESAEMGDMRPSQILRRLEQQLEGMKTDPKLLTQVFLRKLPSTVRTIIAAQEDKLKIEELADLADKVYENLPSSSAVNATALSTATTSDDSARIDRLETLMERLLVSQVSSQNHDSRSRQQHFQRSNTRPRSRSASRGRFNPNGGLCFYHWRFKNRATKCTSPCTWKTPSSQSKNANQQ